MTLSIEFHPEAERDFADIGRYTAERWGTDQARFYLGAITEAVERAAQNPMIGSDYNFVREGLRKLTVRSHKVFYTADATVLRVIRILHERMDVSL